MSWIPGPGRSWRGRDWPPTPWTWPAPSTRSWPGARDQGPAAAANTTIGVVITDAQLTKTQATRLAQVAHDGLARTIRPVHTPMDGDTLFAAATGTVDPEVQAAIAPELLGLLLSVMAAEVTAQAVLRAVRAAEGLRLDDLWLPAWRDLPAGLTSVRSASAPVGTSSGGPLTKPASR